MSTFQTKCLPTRQRYLLADKLQDWHIADSSELKCCYPSADEAAGASQFEVQAQSDVLGRPEVVPLPPEDAALTLAQLRIVRSLLQKHLSSEPRAHPGEGGGGEGLRGILSRSMKHLQS